MTGRQAARRTGGYRCLAILSLCAPLAGCDTLQSSFLFPAGPVAASDRDLFLIVAAILFFVAAPVLGLTPIMAWRFRHGRPNTDYRPTWTFSWVIEGLIWVPPAAIVIGLGILVWTYTQRLDPYRPLAADQPPLEVQVIGLDWKWLFIYPRQHVATVNLLAIPVGRPVHLRITSGTVMQSFFVPKLAGQIYAMPGMTTQLNLMADRAGQVAGENTQFNGKGFQNQHFTVTAMSDADFRQWLAQVQAASPGLDAPGFMRIAAPSSVARSMTFSSIPPDLFARTLQRVSGQPVMATHPMAGMHP